MNSEFLNVSRFDCLKCFICAHFAMFNLIEYGEKMNNDFEIIKNELWEQCENTKNGEVHVEWSLVVVNNLLFNKKKHNNGECAKQYDVEKWGEKVSKIINENLNEWVDIKCAMFVASIKQQTKHSE